MQFLVFTLSHSLFPQACWIILCGPHQRPLGDHFQVLSLQQSCLRPFCVLFAAAPVQEDVEGHHEQGPQEELHQLLGAGGRGAQPEPSAAQRVRSLVWDPQSAIQTTNSSTWPVPSSSPQLPRFWGAAVGRVKPSSSPSSSPCDIQAALDLLALAGRALLIRGPAGSTNTNLPLISISSCI